MCGQVLSCCKPFGNISVPHGSYVEHLLAYHLVSVIVLYCYLKHFAQ